MSAVDASEQGERISLLEQRTIQLLQTIKLQAERLNTLQHALARGGTTSGVINASDPIFQLRRDWIQHSWDMSNDACGSQEPHMLLSASAATISGPLFAKFVAIEAQDLTVPAAIWICPFDRAVNVQIDVINRGSCAIQIEAIDRADKTKPKPKPGEAFLIRPGGSASVPYRDLSNPDAVAIVCSTSDAALCWFELRVDALGGS